MTVENTDAQLIKQKSLELKVSLRISSSTPNPHYRILIIHD